MHQVSSGRSCVQLSQPDCTELPGERPTVGRHGRLAETTVIGNNSEAARASHTTTNDWRPRIRRCYTARLERCAHRHRFCTVTGHFQAALKDSSVWTIVRLTTDLVTCSCRFAYGRINTVVNNNNNNIFIFIHHLGDFITPRTRLRFTDRAFAVSAPSA